MKILIKTYCRGAKCHCVILFMAFQIVLMRSKSTKDNPDIPKNAIQQFVTGDKQRKMGVIYDKKPFRVHCVPNKQYAWCACGYSKTQVSSLHLNTVYKCSSLFPSNI